MWQITILASCCFLQLAMCFNILGIFPFPLKSHYAVFDSLMLALAERGHNVTSYTTFPKDLSSRKYAEVDVSTCFQLSHLGKERVTNGRNIGLRALQLRVNDIPPAYPPVENIFNCEPLLRLRNLTGSFDLLITETFFNDFFAVFGYVLEVPVVLVHSALPFPWILNRAGLPSNPSYLPVPGAGFSGEINFFDRLVNTLMYLNVLWRHKVDSEDKYDEIVPRFFGDGAPRIEDVVRNASLVLSGTDFNLNGARPRVPNVVEIGGISVKPPKQLPKDIENFINESTNGVIYFSMGSILHGESFPPEKRDAFLRAFARLPQRVLWKWEGDSFPRTSNEIMFVKWMPQRDILAHPNVKLFVSHGGLISMHEAVYEGVPILGIPIFSDQRSNLKQIEANKAGEILDYTEISEEVVYEKMSRLLNDSRYKKNAENLSIRYKDRPMSPADTAVYWIEYVIRHRGAHHLKTAAVNLPWYQYFLLDVIAFLVYAIVITFAIIYYTFSSLYKFLRTFKKAKIN